jgi:hypothetical protein
MLPPFLNNGLMAMRSTATINSEVRRRARVTAGKAGIPAANKATVATAPTIKSEPWPKFIVLVVQKVNDKPMAIRAYVEPTQIPAKTS